MANLMLLYLELIKINAQFILLPFKNRTENVLYSERLL